MLFDLFKATILVTVAGSRAYGMATDKSDVDIKGVVVPPVEYGLGFTKRFEQAEAPEHMRLFLGHLTPEEQDVVLTTKLEGVLYAHAKFMKLAADANPNILDVLFCREEEIRHITNRGHTLRHHRQLFLSTKVKHTFSGYAAAQMKRLIGHRRWLVNPPTKEPTRADFGLPDRTLIPADQLATARAAVRQQMDRWNIDFSEVDLLVATQLQESIEMMLAERKIMSDAETDAARAIGLGDNLILVMNQERQYENARKDWEHYIQWKRDRNKERAALEAKFGMDLKHASHLVRLLNMGEEILTTGKVNVWRGGRDAELLLSIRQGAWTYDQIVEYATAKDAALTEIYKSGKSVLPKTPNYEELDKLCVQLWRLPVS